ncbi:hypothetical protein BDD12DRAFT_890720 [Trichophaea hybrida]|nr:hypothetical protein BDD12DRAFT_890720 [Trichophaea hybrida]
MPAEEEPGMLFFLRSPPPPPLPLASDSPTAAPTIASATSTTTTLAVANGKRKRSASTEGEETVERHAGDEEKAQKKKDAMQAVTKDLLIVLKEYDPTPSILSFSLSSIASVEEQSPPTKRPKLSTPIPDTIHERLAVATYESFNVFLSDVSAVCRALMGTLSPTPKATTDGSTSWENVNTIVARVIHFEHLAKDLVNRQRKRLVEWLDFTEELDTNDQPLSSLSKASDKVALTVLTYGGPVFSSLPKADNIVIPSTVSSRSTSTSGSPKSPASTTATSVASDWPKNQHRKAECIAVVTPFIEPDVPHAQFSTVKAIPTSEAEIKKESGGAARIPKLGEVFPPPAALANLPPPQVDYSRIGLKWGGELGSGGIVAHPEVEFKSETSGHWLQYTNFPQPGLSRLPPDPFRQGIGLPANFVAAYSSFAPTRDESLAKVPAAVSNSIWWERRGGRIFRKMFTQDPTIGHMYKQYEPKKQQQQQPDRLQLTDKPQEPNSDLNESEIEKLIESFEELPIDTRLLMSHDAMLVEISSLLSQLQSQQYTRLAATKPDLLPQTDEVKTYLALKDRLTSLIDALPPHVLATIDGHPDSDLILSHKIPILNSAAPVFKGTLPSDDKPPQQQVQTAAMSAINAAAGLSPISPAPVASMLSTPRRVQGAPHLTVGAPPPPVTPQQHPQYGYPQQPQQQRPQYQTPQQQQPYQRPRGSVPPPQGLGAIGVGGGYYPQQQSQQQQSPAVGGAQSPARYSQRVRR